MIAILTGGVMMTLAIAAASVRVHRLYYTQSWVPLVPKTAGAAPIAETVEPLTLEPIRFLLTRRGIRLVLA